MFGEGGWWPGHTAWLPVCPHAEHGARQLPGKSFVIITSSDHRESQHTVTVILVLGNVGGVTCSVMLLKTITLFWEVGAW